MAMIIATSRPAFASGNSTLRSSQKDKDMMLLESRSSPKIQEIARTSSGNSSSQIMDKDVMLAESSSIPSDASDKNSLRRPQKENGAMLGKSSSSPKIQEDSALRSSQKNKGTVLLESRSSPKMRELSWDDVQIGRLLGNGAFSNVKEVTIHTEEGSDERVYAIKFLKDSVNEKSGSLKVAAGDLVMEAKLLGRLSHENIIVLHGISKGALSDANKHNPRNFLVLDLLTCTLDDKLVAWNSEEKVGRQSWVFPLAGLSESQKIRLYERMSDVAIPVANVFQYLHSKNIIFRDLKPGNIGFDVHGTLKIFDFGMAREIEEGRKLTANTGSPLYMSPEVALGKDYGLKADVYSFAYVLWQLATLKIPFEGITPGMHARKVLIDNARPKVDNQCGSTRTRQLIIECWDRSPESRPSFEEILKVLQFETSKQLEGSKGDLQRSTNFRTLVSSQGHTDRGHPDAVDSVTPAVRNDRKTSKPAKKSIRLSSVWRG